MSPRFVPFVLVAAAVLLVPGPSVLYAVTRAGHAGLRTGLVAVLGLESGLGLHVAAACLGLARAVAASPLLLTVLQVAGSAYLLWLGIGLLRRPPTLVAGPAAPPAEPSLQRVYLDGLLVDLLNPKTALFLLAVLPQFVDPGSAAPARELLLLGGTLVALALVVDAGYATLAATLGRLRLGPRAGRRAEIASGGTFLALAAWTLVA